MKKLSIIQSINERDQDPECSSVREVEWCCHLYNRSGSQEETITYDLAKGTPKNKYCFPNPEYYEELFDTWRHEFSSIEENVKTKYHRHQETVKYPPLSHEVEIHAVSSSYLVKWS